MLDRGIDWLPFDLDGQVRIDLICGRGPDGQSRGWIAVSVPAAVLRPLGLHPDQPASRIVGPSQPGWWRAEAMRRLGCRSA